MIRAVDVDAVRVVVIDVKELKLVNELPVSAQVPVGGSAQIWSFGVSKVSLHVDEGGNTLLFLVLPRLAHEGPVEVRLAAE